MRLIILLIFLAPVFVSCDKGWCLFSNKDPYLVPEVADNYFKVFAAGNFWVYKDASGMPDTLHCLSDRSYFVDEGGCKESEARQGNLSSSRILSGSTYFNLSGSKHYLFSIEPLVNVILPYTSAYSIHSTQQPIGSIIVNNKTYSEVLRVYSLSDTSVKYYFSPSVGIVKMESPQDTFLLEKYSVQ